MPINRKRRIFHAGPLAPPRHAVGLRPTLAAGAAAAVLLSGIVLLSLPGTPFGRVPAGGMLRAAAADVAVVDGDTLRLGQGVGQEIHAAVSPR